MVAISTFVQPAALRAPPDPAPGDRRLSFDATMDLLRAVADGAWRVTLDDVPASAWREGRDRVREELRAVLHVRDELHQRGDAFLVAVAAYHPASLPEATDLLARARPRIDRVAAVFGWFAAVDVPGTPPVAAPVRPPGTPLDYAPTVDEVFTWMHPSPERTAHLAATRAERFRAAAEATVRDHGRALDLLADR